MDRYQRVERPRPESAINENEIRITSQGLIRNYISYAASLLQEKQAKEIVLKAMGQAISKTVALAEILKKRTPGLYQDVIISSVSITDVWEPIEEGLVPLETTRHVSMISITLSNKDLNENSPGYQAPVFLEQPKQQYRPQKPQQQSQYQPQQQPQYQQQQHQASQAQNQAVEESSYGRGRGRGRGRGSERGWGGRGGYGRGAYGNGRGYDQGYRNNQGYNWGYGNNQGYNQGYGSNQGYQENGGYWNYGGRGGGRGRESWNYRGAGYEGGRGGGGRGYGGGYESGRGGGGRGYGGGYESGRGGGGRGYGRGRGRMGGRGRGNQAE